MAARAVGRRGSVRRPLGPQLLQGVLHRCRIEKGGRSAPRLSTVERIAAALAQEERSQLLSAVSMQLDEALRLAREHGLVALAGRIRFEIGNLLAQKGDLPGAVRSFLERGERAAALEALDSAIEVATNAEQERLRQEAVRLKAVLEGGGTGAQQ